MPVNTEIHDAVAQIHFDDGGLNIITPKIASQLLQTIEFIDANQDVHTLLIEGNGKSFSAGLDLTVLREGGVAATQMLIDTGKFLRFLYQSRLRVVSLCAGHALAAGAMILLISDYRVGVSDSGKIGFSEVANGLELMQLPVLLARDRLNPKEVFAATVLARMYGPQQAEMAGFLDVVMGSYKEARYHAIQEAHHLSNLDDHVYLTAMRRVRHETLSALEKL